MNKIREIARLNEQCHLSERKIARTLNISRPIVGKYLSAIKEAGLSYSQMMEKKDSEILTLFQKEKGKKSPRYEKFCEKFEYFVEQLQDKNVDLRRLWEEYREENPDGYGYSQFCYNFQELNKALEVSMHIEHKAGDRMFVDFTGRRLEIVDGITGEIKPVEVFVAILGASQLTYVEALENQKKENWIKGNDNAFQYFGGVTNGVTPDCLKSAVSKTDPYEPDINPEYADFAAHYGTVILPARPAHPKDKALVENMVGIVYSRIFAPLRNQTFFSLFELNEAIKRLLENHNNKPFQKMKISRRQLFEETEKKALKRLPERRYEIKRFQKAKVGFNYHVELKEDRHYYSVPYEKKGKGVKVVYTDREVEIFEDITRIAFHLRNRSPFQYTTKSEHMPPEHAFYAGWSPEKMVQWGASLGEEVKSMIEKVLKNKPHPEQGYKSCLGIIHLSKKYEKERLNKACEKALSVESYSYKTVKNILEKGLDKVEEEKVQELLLPLHENLRGSEYFNQ